MEKSLQACLENREASGREAPGRRKYLLGDQAEAAVVSHPPN